MANLIGQSVGRYHIVEQLGEGGMATVYKAFDTRLERYVAIKFIRTDAVKDAIFLKRFEREAKALAKLSHPNIVKVHDFGNFQGAPYLVMEFIPGGTLKQKLGKPIHWIEAAGLILPIARTLEYTHKQNIIHRDVKPANFLMTESDSPMLSDFGIAKMMESTDAAQLTETGVGIGTPEYMAPEQGLGKKIDQRADIYSLGIVFYEQVTGVKPFRADTPMAVLYMQITDPLPSPRSHVPSIPETVERILFKALAKKPEDRYQNMGEFAAALENLTRVEQPATQIEQPAARIGPPATRAEYPSAQMRPHATRVEPHAARMVPPPVKPMPFPEVQPEKKRGKRWIVGAILIVVFGCIGLIAIGYIYSTMVENEQNTASTGTAISLGLTIEARDSEKTREASDRQATEEASIREATAQAQSIKETFQAESQNATGTAEALNRDATLTAESQNTLNTQATADVITQIVNRYNDANASWGTAFSDNFSFSDTWYNGDLDSEWWYGNKSNVSGKLRWEMTAYKGFYHFEKAETSIYYDFIVTVECEQISGSTNGVMGLILRWSNDVDKYYFTINTNTQEYEFLLYQGGEWATLVAETSPSIIINSLNKMTILAEGSSFTIFINDDFITLIEDASLFSGEIGLIAGLFNPDETAVFEFDNMIIKTP